MYGLANTRAGLNLVNIEYHQSVTELHPNLVLKFAYLKDMNGVDILNISVVDGGKKRKQGKGGVYVTAVINYKTTLVVNGKLATVFLDLGEGVACDTIFSWMLLKKIKASIITDNNALISGLLGYQFNLDMMVSQITKGATKKSVGIPVTFPIEIQEERK